MFYGIQNNIIGSDPTLGLSLIQLTLYYYYYYYYYYCYYHHHHHHIIVIITIIIIIVSSLYYDVTVMKALTIPHIFISLSGEEIN
jgi:hypothetical protein